MVVVVDQQANAKQLVGIAAGTLVLGLIALVMTLSLGDCVRVMGLRFTGIGFAEPDRKKLARKLSLRALLLGLVLMILLLVGLPLVIALNAAAA
jgi:hypothetical protein